MATTNHDPCEILGWGTLVDIRMTFEYRALGVIRGTGGYANCAAVVRHARPEDIRPLRGIARESYYDARFGD